MKQQDYFDIRRFGYLLRMELFRSRKGILITLVVIFGILFFVALPLDIFVEENKGDHEYDSNYAFLLIAGGAILSSLAFHDLSSPLRRYRYLTLPVSALEKFVGMWLLTTVGWIVLFTGTYTVYTLVANAVGRWLLGDIDFQAFNPFGFYAIEAVRYYLVLQAIFLVGAVQFRGYVLPKTLFALTLLGVAGSIVTYLFAGLLFNLEDESLSGAAKLEQMHAYGIGPLGRWLFWWGLAPLCWVITYQRLKKQEV